MIVLLPTSGKFAMGNDFPLFTIPLEMPDATTQSLEDYQWWAYSKDFMGWLKANPRQWVADSEDMSRYSSMSELIRESFSGYDYQAILNEYERQLKISESRVSKFDDYNSLYEDNQSTNTAEGEKYIKFHFAYNKILSDGTLESEYIVANQKEDEDKAVFLCVEDQSTGENVMETLDAYKMSPLKIETSSQAKFKLFEVKDRKLNGPIPENSDSTSVVEDAINTGIKVGVYSAATIAIWTGIKYLGTGIALRTSWKGLQGLTRIVKGIPKPPVNPSTFWQSVKTGVGGLWGAVKSMAVLKNTRAAISGTIRGVKGAKAAYTLGKVGFSGALKAFAKGAGRGFTKAGGKAIPFVGEVLMIIDAVGSTWNWYSKNQAPRYGEVEAFAKETFDPKAIEVGVPITVCWSQPAGGWGGAAVSFFFSNETRTTMELIKVGENSKNQSVFILVQINSKEIQKQLATADLTLIAFDNSDKVERGMLDNEDLDFEILSIKNDAVSLLNYQGSCPWDTFENAFEEANGSLLIADPNAPDTYEFHFSDSEDNIINVIGEKVPTEDLKNYSASDLNRIFGVEISNETKVRNKIEGKKDFAEEEKEVAAQESLSFNWMVESKTIITNFADFKNSTYRIVTEDNEQKGGPINKTKGNPEEGAEDADSKGGKVTLTPQQKSGPAEVAIYLVKEKDYANPEMRGRYETGQFTNFLLDPSDYTVKIGQRVEVDPNTDEILEDSKRGLYTYVPPKKEEDKPRPKVDDDVRGDEEDKKDDAKDKDKDENKKADDYYMVVSPKDVEIKNRKSATVIRDHSLGGGVNLFDKILTDRDKEVLKIENWKAITFAKELLDNKGDVTEVRLKNKYAPFGDKSRSYRVTDGEAFELAKRFVDQTQDRIKYE